MAPRAPGFTARYEGTCFECREPIAIGDLIRYDVNDDIVHSTHRGASTPERPVVICAVCWLVRPCECDA